jgi:3-isopropylmalate/(R)-2-methylmalate dehydratase large subunit
MRVRFEGQLAKGVSAKDLILFLIGKHGAAGGAGCVVEFAGSAVRALEIESRLTLCNMAIEFGAWTGLVAPDDTTIDYVNGRHFTPKGRAWDAAVDYWRTIISDDAAEYDQEILLDASSIRPQVTWGTNPQQVIAVDEPIPQIRGDSGTQQADSNERALSYMGLTAGQSLAGLTIDAAFIGSCTNSRISDLREAAKVLRGRHVAVGLRAVCVPGSSEVARQAQQEGLDNIFRLAGFEWHNSGCSMCFYAGGEHFGAKARVISSTNRNFEGRQGPGVRTHLASAATVAACAVLGRIGHAGELR